MGPDRVVVGGGLAGMVAALHLAEQGLNVVVLERGDQDGGMGNARISGGLLHVAWEAMDAAPEELDRRLIEATGGFIEPELRGALAANAWRATSWLIEHGVRIAPKGAPRYMQHALAPHQPNNRGWRFIAERGPDRAMCRLYGLARDCGARVCHGAEARALQRAGGAWAVSYVADGGTHSVRAEGVLIADGGFPGNPEMLTRYVGPNAADCVRRATPASTGRGLEMLMSVGAGVTGLGRVYGHMLSLAALNDDAFWPHPTLDRLCLDGLLIDRHGRRFATDASDGVQLVNELARTEDPRGHTAVFDHAQWAGVGSQGAYGAPSPNPTIRDGGGVVHEASSWAGLADLLGVPVDRLQAAVDAHHADPRRTPILEPPFVAVPVVPGITFTMGGVRTDASGHVLDGAGDVLPGLWAAGGVAGGLHGGPQGGYVGGLAVALVFGLLAGESMAA